MFYPEMVTREEMLAKQLKARRIYDRRVLEAMAKVPREEFVDPESREQAYEDRPLTIACQQTISQPYIVALMLQNAELLATDSVLEIGTGSGYQTALLAELVGQVVSVERHPELAAEAARRLSDYRNVQIVVADGTLGYAERAPYDAIIVSAAAPYIPSALVQQLACGGRMVLPVGDAAQQDLLLVRKAEAGSQITRIDGCSFVPLIGEQGFRD